MDKTAKSILEKLIDIFDYILARDECHYDDIERDLGVSRKTVYVYLNFLEEVCGVAIERQKGRYGYVRLSKAWRRANPHIMPDDEEMLLEVYEEIKSRVLKYKLALFILRSCNPDNIEGYRAKMSDVLNDVNNHR